MRAAHGVLVALALCALQPAREAGATPPITEAWYPPADSVAADTSREWVARQASGIAYSTTNTGVVAGLGCMIAAGATSVGGVFFLGAGVLAAGIVAGPALGWDRAGYHGRATVSALVRIGIIAGAVAIPLSNPETHRSEFGGLAVFGAGLTGLTVALIEGYIECSEVGPYVREHGSGPARVALAPVLTPTGAPALALVVRFR